MAAAAVAAAVVAMCLRLPGAAILWVGLVVAGLFSVAPLLTGPKDTTGYPTPAGPGERRSVRMHRLWSELRWRLITPSSDWLPNRPENLADFTAGCGPAAWMARIPWLANRPWLCSPVGFIQWLLIPARPLYFAALGAAAVCFTLPTDSLHPDLVWVNAAAAAVTIVQVDASLRRTVDRDDPSPGVTAEAVARKASRAPGRWFPVALIVGLGVVAGAGTWWVVALTGIGWLIYPSWLFGAGVGATVAAAGVHGYARQEALTGWRQTRQARAEWAPRWQAMKLDPAPYLLEHHRVGASGTTVDTFEAAGQHGGADGLTKLYPKLLPLLGSGVRVAMLPTPNIDQNGQPLEGTRHPLRFRVVTWQLDTIPDASDTNVDQEELGLFLETLVYHGTLEAQQFQPVFIGLQQISAHDGDVGGTAAYASYWAGVEAPPTDGLAASVGRVQEVTGQEAYADTQDGTGVLYVGAVTADSTKLHDPRLLERLEELSVTARWGVRWADTLKQGARPPVLQYAFKREATLADGTVIHNQPFLVKQGLDPTEFFHPLIRKGLATTLVAAPFVTVTGYQVQGHRNGERHPQGFSVIWSHDPVPADPASLSPAGNREAVRWVLAGAVNDAFDAAKLARPEVTSTVALTARKSPSHIWAITLRLYGGVTTAAVKAAAEKIRATLGCEWLRVTETEDGCALYAGTDPRARGLLFANPAASNQNKAIALDWEQAFLDAKVVGIDGGAPKLVSSGVMPKNQKVQVLEFTIPRGFSVGAIREATQKLRAASRNDFVEVRPAESADSFTLLVCESNPMPFPAPFQWDDLATDHGVLFGTGVDGDHVRYDWGEDPHLLVVGGTGSGKSAFLQVVLTASLMKGCDVYLADPTKLAADFRYADPWMKATAVDVLSTSAMMDAVYQEVRRRVALNGEHSTASYLDLPEDVRPPHIVVIIDEFTSLMIADTLPKATGNENEQELRDRAVAEAENTAKKNIGAKAGRLVREARSAGVTLVLAGQELKKDTIDQIPNGTSLKGGMARIVLGKASFGDLASGLKSPQEAPDLGHVVPRGRGIFESSREKPMAFQGWFDGSSSAEHLTSMVTHLTAARPHLTAEEKADLTALLKPVEDRPVFGERILRDADQPISLDATHEDPETVIDLGDGVLELDLGFDFTDDRDEEGGPPLTVDTFPRPARVDASAFPGDAALLLDVDRSLCPVADSAAWPDMTLLPDTEHGAVWCSPTLFEKVGQLPARLLWLTDWGQDANVFAPMLGRDDAETLTSDSDGDRWWKLEAFRSYLETHPGVTRVAWVEDRLAREDRDGVVYQDHAERIAAELGRQLLVVAPDDGLTPQHVEELSAFLTAPPPAPTVSAPAPPTVIGSVSVAATRDLFVDEEPPAAAHSQWVEADLFADDTPAPRAARGPHAVTFD